MYLQQQYEKPAIRDENMKIKLSDIDFNLETLINSKSKSKKEEQNTKNLHQRKSDEDSSTDESDFEPELVKKKTKKEDIVPKKRNDIKDYINN